MVREVRRYGRWLRDNYADLEHKEVWQSFLVLATILLVFGIYVSGVGGLVYEYIVQVGGILLICYLLWRVEMLSDLSIRQPQSYNAYINNLRINHFVSLYRETVAAQRAFTAQQLAHDSGYRSYSTFSLAFKQRMGQSVTAWMRHSAE